MLDVFLDVYTFMIQYQYMILSFILVRLVLILNFEFLVLRGFYILGFKFQV